MKKLQAALYARVSTDEQTNNFSLDSQVAAMQEYARLQDFEIPDDLIFREDYTGTALDRPELSRLLAITRRNLDSIRNNQAKFVDVVIFFSADRLARKSNVAQAIRDRLASHAVTVHYVSRGELGDSPEDKALATVEDAFVQLWRDRIVQDMLRGKKSKAASGLWVGAGSRPYGYNVIGKGKNTKLEIIPQEAAIIRECYERFAAGEGMAEIAHSLQERGLPLPTNITWRKNPAWDRETVSRILKHPRYAGTGYAFRFEHYKDEAGIEHRRKRKLEDTIPIPYPVIIEPDLWYQVQERIGYNLKHYRGPNKFQYMLSGHIRCSCGRTVQGATNRPHVSKGYVGPAGQIRYYPHYRCVGSSATSSPPELVRSAFQEHKHMQIACYMIDDLVWDFIVNEIQHPENIRRKLLAGQAESEARRKEFTDRLAELEQAIRKQEQVLSNILDMEIENRQDAHVMQMLAGKKQSASAFLKDLEFQKTRLSDQLAIQTYTGHELEQFQAFADSVRDTISGATLSEKQRIIRLSEMLVTLDYQDNFNTLEISWLGGCYTAQLPDEYRQRRKKHGRGRLYQLFQPGDLPE